MNASNRTSPRAVATRSARPHTGLGRVVVGLALTVAASALTGRAARGRREIDRGDPARQRAIGRARDGAALLSFSVLADSALEHYRGGFHHQPMYAAPTVGALSLAANMAEPQTLHGRPLSAAHAAAIVTGLAGLGFHLRNLTRRPGGLCWNNIFYAAPLGAPGSLATAGLIGSVTHAMGNSARRPEEGANLIHGRELAAVSAVALAGETAEVALLHFRGAFHDPFMYLPVTLPPLAAAGLAAEAVRPNRRRRRTTRRLLYLVNALGVVGTAFHVLGVARNMGGWENWRQTALQGPPTPAPISFTGLGESGLAALDLLDLHDEGRP